MKFLEEEVGLLRRRLTNAPRQVTLLEEKLVETREQLGRRWARTRSSPTPCGPNGSKIEALAEEVEKLSPAARDRSACTSRTNDDGSIDVFTAGRKMRVMPAPDLDERAFRPGRRRSS